MAVAADIINSVRSQIPDRTTGDDASLDGSAFSLAEILRWLNDAFRVMAEAAPIVRDWYAVQSTINMDLYTLPAGIMSVEQLWYDLFPCWRSPELDALFVSKINARSYFFGPHSTGAQPVLHVWPAADRTGATTTLSGAIGTTDTSIAVADLSSFKQYGFMQIDNEIIAYRQVTAATNTFSAILRGQGLTVAATHANGATVTELNIFFKCSRLPRTLTLSTDTVDIPLALVPIAELYVLSKVREAEQQATEAKSLRDEFNRAIQTMESKAQMMGLRQGLQVRTEPPGPYLWFGRLYVP